MPSSGREFRFLLAEVGRPHHNRSQLPQSEGGSAEGTAMADELVEGDEEADGYPPEVEAFHAALRRLVAVREVTTGLKALADYEPRTYSFPGEFGDLPHALLRRTGGGLEDEAWTNTEFELAKDINDRMASADGPIKTFPLRGIKDSPPYLRDGRLLTLDDTVAFFTVILELKLTAAEKADLVAFLRAL